MSLTLEESSLEEICPLLERFSKEVLSQNKPIETVQNDLFYVLIVVLMLENGFLPVINGSVVVDAETSFDIRHSTVEKLRVGLYKTEFVMSGFNDLSLNLIISPLGALMLVNIVFNKNSTETYSVCLPISRYVVSAQASTIPLIFRNLKHLSLTFKNTVLSAAKSKILSYYGYASASLVGIPDDIIVFNVLLYLPIESIINVSRTCKRLKAVVDNESLWREIYKRDFRNLVSPKLSGWRITYKETYLSQKENLRNSTSNRTNMDHHADSYSFLEDRRNMAVYQYNPLRDVI